MKLEKIVQRTERKKWRRVNFILPILALVIFSTHGHAATITVDPGAFPDDTDLTNAYAGVTLIADIPTSGGFVTNSLSQFAMRFPDGGSNANWTDTGFVRIFQADFVLGTDGASVDMREGSLGVGPVNGVFEAYDAGGGLLETVTVPLASGSTYQTLTITRASPDIMSIRAYGTGSSGESAQISLLTYELRSLSCVGFEFPMNAGAVTVKKNRVLPHKAQLLDESGMLLNDFDIAAPPVIQVLFTAGLGPAAVDVTGDALSAGAGNAGNQFEFLGNRWQFNLKTKSYTAPGTYTTIMESGDPVDYVIDPTCTSSFVIN